MYKFKRKKKKIWQRGKTPFKVRNHKNIFFKKKKNTFANKKNKIILLFLFISFIVYCIFFSELFMIKNINIDGNQTISKKNIEEIVRKENLEKNLLFFSQNNFFINNKKNIEEKLFLEFSEIKSISIKKKFPNTVKIEIIEKNPLILWCRAENCYYLDNEGVAFMAENNEIEAYKNKKLIKITEEIEITEEIKDDTKKEENDDKIKYFQNRNGRWQILTEKNGKEYYEIEDKNQEMQKIYLEIKEDIILLPIKIGEKIADKNFINFAVKLDSNLKKDAGLKIKYYKTKGVKTREIIAYTDKNIRIYFNAIDSLEMQIKYLNDFMSKAINKNEVNILEYIYLKSENKIFYK